MQLISHRPLAKIFSLFSKNVTPQSFSQSQSDSQSKQLSQMIQQQKRINDLVYVCQKDSNGRINCKWVKACLI